MDEWNVYPNPTDGILHISGTDTNVCKYRLYSVDGRLVQEGSVSDSVIDISGQVKGMYILKIETKESILQRTVILR